MAKYPIIFISIVLIICSCPNPGSSTSDNDEINPEDYPEIEASFIRNYGAPNYWETVSYTIDGMPEIVTRAIWDDTGNSYSRSITNGQVISASFISSSLTNYNWADLDSEDDLIAPYISLFGDVEATGYWDDDTSNEYEEPTFEIVLGVYDSYRIIDKADTVEENEIIDYWWWDVDDNLNNVELEHLLTLENGTKIYVLLLAETYNFNPDSSYTEQLIEVVE